MNISKLPDEILVLIFSHLQPRELLDNVTKVCNRWKHLSADVSLWREVYCYGGAREPHDEHRNVEKLSGVSVKEIKWLGKHGIKITHLRLYYCTHKDVKSVLKCCIKNMMPLKALNLNAGTEIHSSDVIKLAKSSIGFKVTEIDIRSFGVQRTNALCFTHFPNLEKFKCFLCHSIILEEFKMLLPNHFSKLRELSLSLVELPDDYMKKILNNLKNFKYLMFEECKYEAGVAFDAFRGNTTLEKVHIWSSRIIDDPKYNTLVDYTPIVSLPNLATLFCDFDNSYLSPPRLMEFASKSITTLEFIDTRFIHDNYSSDEMLVAIARNLTQLRTFKLESNEATDDGLNDFLLKANKLEKFKVDNSGDGEQLSYENGFIELHGDKWVNVIGTHPTLKELDLKYCKFLKKKNKKILKASAKMSGVKLTI